MRQTAAPPVLVDKLLHRRIVGQRLKQLNEIRSGAYAQQRFPNLVGAVDLLPVHLAKPQHFIRSHLRIEIAPPHCNRNVVDKLEAGDLCEIVLRHSLRLSSGRPAAAGIIGLEITGLTSSKMRYRIAILLLFCSLSRPAQDLAPPRGWTVDQQPSILVFAPMDLRAGQQVRVELHDAEPAQGELSQWLVSRLESADARRCRPKLRHGTEASCVINSREGDHYYYGLRTADGHYRLVHVLMGPNTLSAVRYLSGVRRLLEDAEANRGFAGVPDQPTAKTAQEPRSTGSAAPQPVSGDFFRPPIEGIYLHLEYLAGVGGGIYPSYEPYILLQDGSITDDLSYYPRAESDMAAWRARKPRAWGRWTRNGFTVSIRWNDPRRKPETWDKWFVARPGDPALALSGLYQSIGGGGNTALGGDFIAAAWKDFRFSPNGIVTAGAGSGSYSGGSGTGVSVATSSQKAAQQARYRIERYTIRLDYMDGRSERRWFYRFPDSDKALGIGGSTYSLRQ